MDELELLPSQPASVPFPTDSWEMGAPIESVDGEKLQRLTEAAFAEHDFTAGPTPDLVAILLGPAQIELAGSCCSQRVLAAGVVQLCTAVRFDELTESAQNAIVAACQVAAGWLEEIESRVLPAGSERPG